MYPMTMDDGFLGSFAIFFIPLFGENFYIKHVFYDKMNNIFIRGNIHEIICSSCEWLPFNHLFLKTLEISKLEYIYAKHI